MIIPMLSKFARVDVKRSAGWLDRPEVFCATRFLHTNLRDFVLAGVVRRVEGLRGRNSPFEAREAGIHRWMMLLC